MYSHQLAQTVASLPLDAISHAAHNELPLPFVEGTVPAGFPSPAADFHVKRQDLNDLLIRNPVATFYIKARGNSMQEAGIMDGDYLIVDRSVRPAHMNIVLAQVDNDYTVKYLHKKGTQISLRAANPTFPPILFKDGQTLVVVGVVIGLARTY